VTGGGTGSHRIDAELGVLTELQPGSYAFMDREYAICDLDDAGSALFAKALLIDARVISANHSRFVTVDAGLKSFSSDAGSPPVLAGAPVGSEYRFLGDEHGAVIGPADARPAMLGARVTLGAPHCDPTVNLYDAYHVVRDDTLVAIWPVTARGRSD
jgi:3-hydroxy-D-aspartate aldolase